MDNNFLNLFKRDKPIIGMIHLGGYTKQDIIDNAIKEISILISNGADAVLVENYFCNWIEVIKSVLEYLEKKEDIVYGLNILGNYKQSFELADKYNVKFIQIDSVAGHLTSSSDETFDLELRELRSKSKAYILGGVRFKYQPYLSGNDLETDLKIGMNRSDAIVVTGNGTGKETELDKIKKFRNILGNFPLIIGAGLTVDNCIEQLNYAELGIVGSYFKENHVDYGEMSNKNVKTFMKRIEYLRRD